MSHRLNYRTTNCIHFCKCVTRKSFLACKKGAIIFSEATVKIRVKNGEFTLGKYKENIERQSACKGLGMVHWIICFS